MTMKNFIGIDPGKTGAIVVFGNDGVIAVADLPLQPDGRLNAREFAQAFEVVDQTNCICYIEKAQAFPQQGSVSMFNYGVNYGQIISVLEMLKIPFQEIKSPEWKKEFNLIHKEKEDSVTMAIHLYPGMEDIFIKKRGEKKPVLLHGRAEALLIAVYAIRKSGNK